jgi:hypothetical protein
MPSYASDKLLDRIRHDAAFGPCAGSSLAIDALTLCARYEELRASALKMEDVIHAWTK